jgi:hypothetical protein
MRKMMKLAESGNMLLPFARHVSTNQGLVYPVAPDVEYIRHLDVPGGDTMIFEDIFQKALNNIVELWGWMALSLQNRESRLDTLPNWSLDTGIDENNPNIMIYWS